MADFRLRIGDQDMVLNSAIRNLKSAIGGGGPEAHQDEFSTFNRGVVGSTPTRPIWSAAGAFCTPLWLGLMFRDS